MRKLLAATMVWLLAAILAVLVIVAVLKIARTSASLSAIVMGVTILIVGAGGFPLLGLIAKRRH